MGDMLRSDQMTLCQLFIPVEAAYFVISELGEIGTVQFKDLNKNVTAFQRNYVSDVRRCHEMERGLRYIESEIEKSDVTIPLSSDISRAPAPNEINALKMHIMKAEEEIKRLTENTVNLKVHSLELLEFKLVLEKTECFFKKRDEILGLDPIYRTSEDVQNVPVMRQLNFVTGVITRERAATFETMLWRISKGNVFFKRIEIEKPLEDPLTGIKHYKTVFVICFQGKLLMTRINKLCEGFRVSLYTCPNSPTERKKLLESVGRRLDDIKLVLSQTQAYRHSFLIQVANTLQYWSTVVTKIKAIYHILNFLSMDVTGKCLIGECWIPVRNISIVKKALSDGSKASGCSVFSFLYVVKTNEEPPTFNRTNKFTRGFQNLIDIYGVASYQEANPALYSIVTFPFIFAMMFGDVGHAIILIIFGLYLVMIERKVVLKKINSEIFRIFFAGRYLILLMGIFSLYTGLIYNDMFSKSINLFGSSWNTYFNETWLISHDGFDLDPAKHYKGTPYWFGIDPIWAFSSNHIIFLNSYKMKISIIFGVVHMILGLCINVINIIHFKKYSYIFLEFIPQLVILCSLFLWLIFMMFIKWIFFSAQSEDPKFGTSCAPSILKGFINMMLFKENVPVTGCHAYLFQFQPKLQKFLVVISLISICIMLLGRPLYIKYKGLRKSGKRDSDDVNTNLAKTNNENVKNVNFMVEHEEKEENFTDIFIIQIINTIEYGLGTISHTASYLRLWALSLAHTELSAVLWNKLLGFGLKFSGYGGAIALAIFFLLWLFFTLAILVVMEGLSAFLHTLRLHWVEFMSKFYSGKGYPFEPFSFKIILEEEQEYEEEKTEAEEKDDKLKQRDDEEGFHEL